MAPIPLPRRGFRSLLVLFALIWLGYMGIRKLNSYSDPSSQTVGMVVRPLEMLQQYQGRGRKMMEAAMRGRGVGAGQQVLAETEDELDPDEMDDGGEEDVLNRPGHAPIPKATTEAGQETSEDKEEPVMVNRKPKTRTRTRTRKKRLPEHDFSDNGLLKVNPLGQHPIFDLVEYAGNAWRNKTEKASKTLKQAVDEYRRRYGRAPPRGFDRWWEYAKKHNVQLPDEYDQIYRDLEPFHALKASNVITLVRQASLKDGMYTILCPGPDAEGNPRKCSTRVNERGLNEEGRKVAYERIEAQMDLIREIEGELEKVEVVFYSHDVPWQFVGHEYKSALEDSASVGEYYNVDEHELDSAHLGWASACAPHKALRESYDIGVYPDLNAVWQETDKSFIWDHRAAMDPCTHPTITHLQGFLSAHGKGPGPSKDLYPVLAMCKTMLHSDVLAVSMENWTEDVGDDPPWDEKKDERLVWRGKTTGILFNRETPWEISQRINLVSRTSFDSGSIPVLPNTTPGRAVGLAHETPMDELNEDMMDIAFVDEPIQCEPETCAKVKNGYKFADRMTWDETNQFKYLLDIDGNGWSARFKRLMTSNSLVLKSTIFPEWYSDRVQPWIHYVPVKSDLTDLYDIMTFFRSGHDDMARKIAKEGTTWSKTFWRREDMISYQFRLMLELARLMAFDREAASYTVSGAQLLQKSLLDLPADRQGRQKGQPPIRPPAPVLPQQPAPQEPLVNDPVPPVIEQLQGPAAPIGAADPVPNPDDADQVEEEGEGEEGSAGKAESVNPPLGDVLDPLPAAVDGDQVVLEQDDGDP